MYCQCMSVKHSKFEWGKQLKLSLAKVYSKHSSAAFLNIDIDSDEDHDDVTCIGIMTRRDRSSVSIVVLGAAD